MTTEVCPMPTQVTVEAKSAPEAACLLPGTCEQVTARLAGLAMGTEADACGSEGNTSVLDDVANLGLGAYTLYKMRKLGRISKAADSDDESDAEEPQEEQDTTTDPSEPQAGTEKQYRDMDRMAERVQMMIEKQLYLAAWFATGLPPTEGWRERFRNDMDGGVENFVESLSGTVTKRLVCDFYVKLDMLAKKYHTTIKAVVCKGEFPQYLKDDIKEIKRRAEELYSWAKLHLSEKPKLAVMQNMPYIVAMAFAVRAEMDACIAESEMAVCTESKDFFLNRCRELGNKFLKVVVGQLSALFGDSTLLDVAFDLHTHMGVYVTLIKSFRASLELLEAADTAEYEDVYSWNDGLAPLRKVLHRVPDDASRNSPNGCIISLDNVGEMILWLGFLGADLFQVGKNDLKPKIHVRHICYALGAAFNRIDIHQFRIKADRKPDLLHLSSASTLRRNLWEKVKAALGPLRIQDGRPILSWMTFAVTRNITEIKNMPNTISRQAGPQSSRGSRQSQNRTSSSSVPRVNPSTFSGRLRLSSQGYTEAVRAVAVCAEAQRMVSGIDDGTLRIWSGRTGELERSIETEHQSVLCVALSSDGKRVVSGGSDSTIRLWNADIGEKQLTLKSHRDKVLAVAMTPPGDCVISGSRDRTIKIWNATTGQKKMTLRGHRDSVFGLVVTPDGSKLISASGDKKVKVWSLQTGRLLRTLSGHTDIVQSVAVCPDGERVVSGSRDKSIKVWNLSTGALELTLMGHAADVNAVAVLHDGRRLVSASDDKTIKVWNLETRLPERTLAGHCDYVNSLAICARGSRVVSGSGDGTTKLWN